MIANGSVVTYTGTWQPTTLQNGDTIVAAVAADIQAAGLMNRGGSNTYGASSMLLGSSFSVTMNLQVENGMGFGTPDDIISIIRHYVLNETGNYPVSDAIPYVQAQGSQQQSTGQPDVQKQNVPAGCISGTSTDTTGSWSFSCWFKSMTTAGLASFGTLALLALLGIGLFIFAGGRKIVSGGQ